MPLYIRLGFYSKKGLAIVAIIALMADLILPILMAEDVGDRGDVLKFALPYWAIISAGVLLFHWAGQKIFYKINWFFGIDLRPTNNKSTKEDQCQLKTLFKENYFKPYQEFAVEHLTGAAITIIAAIIAIIIVILTLFVPYFLELDPRAKLLDIPSILKPDSSSDINNIQFKSIYFGIIIILSLIWFWILFSGIGTLLLVLNISWVFGKMDKFQGLTIESIGGIIEEICKKKQPIDFLKTTEVLKLSIKRFKRRYDDVPDFLVKTSIVIFIELFLIIYFTSYYFKNFFIDLTGVAADIMDMYMTVVTIAAVGPLLIVIIIIISIILLIIAPQWSFHTLLVKVKESVLDTLEELYERKKLQYLEMIQTEIKEDRKILLEEVESLKKMIADVEDISTLPFKENHIITLVSSMILPFIPLFQLIDIAMK